ncbi:hypothetical protein [Reyranella sp.]|uniref:hypothetical protein n=1 Tax=Reyranella sp. TaxID=1929291 RepID=UPI003782F730
MPKIVVHPSGAESDLLPARDALNQILDFVDLLVQSHPDDDHAETVIWLLASITSNTPITAEVSGAGADPAVPVVHEALRSMTAVEDGISAAMEGRDIPRWMLNGAYNTARRFFDRNTKAIGRTDLVFDGVAPTILIAPAGARIALINLERAALEEEKKVRDWTHKARGSIEGIVIDTTTFYGKPAIRVRERLSRRDIMCVLDEANAVRVGDKYNWQKTWDHGRVHVEGLLHYDKSGDVIRVSDADVIDVAVSRSIDLAEFSDSTFTNGLTPAEYLERWRSRGRD